MVVHLKMFIKKLDTRRIKVSVMTGLLGPPTFDAGMHAYTPVMLSFEKDKLNDHFHKKYCHRGVLKQFHEKCQITWYKLRMRRTPVLYHLPSSIKEIN